MHLIRYKKKIVWLHSLLFNSVTSILLCLVAFFISVNDFFLLNDNIADLLKKIYLSNIRIFIIPCNFKTTFTIRGLSERTRLERKSKRFKTVLKAGKPFRVKNVSCKPLSVSCKPLSVSCKPLSVSGKMCCVSCKPFSVLC